MNTPPPMEFAKCWSCHGTFLRPLHDQGANCPACRADDMLRKKREREETRKKLYEDFQNGKFNGRHSPQPTRQASGAIPDDMLQRLIMLCHPDKHGGSVMSQTATQWLLSQRR